MTYGGRGKGVREERKRKIDDTYGNGWFVIVGDGSPVCCPKYDCHVVVATDRVVEAVEMVVDGEV